MDEGLGVGAPVPPAERPRKERAAARVVVVADGCFLLGERFDPGRQDCRWWQTPGGGIDEGEDARGAAVREIAEELGVDVEPDALLGPVARRVVVHGYTDQVARQSEDYFLLPLAARIEPRHRLQTPRERATSGPWRWLAPAELADRWVWDDVVLLWSLRDAPERWVVDLGEIEQSVVPADAE